MINEILIIILLLILLWIVLREKPEQFRPRQILSDPAHDYDYARDMPAYTLWDVKPWVAIHPCNTSYVQCNSWI